MIERGDRVYMAYKSYSNVESRLKMGALLALGTPRDQLTEQQVSELFQQLLGKHKRLEDAAAVEKLWERTRTVDQFRLMQLLFFHGVFPYSPWYGASTTDPETAPFVERLLEMNRLGFITSQSQPADCHAGYSDYTRRYYESEQKPWVEGLIPRNMLSSVGDALADRGWYVTTSIPLELDVGPESDEKGRWLSDEERPEKYRRNIRRQRRQVKKHGRTIHVSFPVNLTRDRVAKHQADVSRQEWRLYTNLRIDGLDGNDEIYHLRQAGMPVADEIARTYGYLVAWGGDYCRGNALFDDLVAVLTADPNRPVYINERPLASELQAEKRRTMAKDDDDTPHKRRRSARLESKQ